MIDYESNEINNKNEEFITNTCIISFNFTGYDTLLIVFLFFFSIFSRFWLLPFPRIMVQIEYDFLTYLHKYNNLTFFFNNDPPLGKLLFLPILKKMEYEYNYPLPPPNNNFIYPTIDYNNIRSISAFFSSIVPSLIYITLRCFKIQLYYSLLGGVLSLTEFSLISTSRYINDKGILQFFLILFFLFCSISNHFLENSEFQILFLILQSICCGICISINYNSLFLYLFLILWIFNKYKKLKKILYFLIFILPILILYLSFLFHLLLLPKKSEDLNIFTNFTKSIFIQNVLNYQSINLKHLIITFELLFKSLINRFYLIFQTFQLSIFFNRIKLQESLFLIYSNETEISSCFNNYFITSFSLIILIISLIINYILKIKNYSNFLNLIFLISLFIYSIDLNENGSLDSYLIYIFLILNLCINLNLNFSNFISSLITTILILFSILIFFDLSSLIYCFNNSNSLLKFLIL